MNRNAEIAETSRTVWSARHLALYRTCPRQYRYAYCDKVAVRPTAALLFGRTMHETLHRLYGRSLEGGIWPDDKEAKYAFDEAWQNAVKRERPLFKAGGPDAAKYQELAVEMLQRFLARQRSRPLPLATSMAFEVGSEKEIGGERNGYRLSGSIDLLEEDEDGVTLLDVTTAARKSSPSQMADDLTLTAYAQAARSILGSKNVRLLRFHLRDGSCRETSRSEAECDHLQDETMPQAAQAAAAGNFPLQSGYWCRFCPYMERCTLEEIEKGEGEKEELAKAGEISCAS